MNADARGWRLLSAGLLVALGAATAVFVAQTGDAPRTIGEHVYDVTVDSAQVQLACPPGASDPLQPGLILTRPVTLAAAAATETPLDGGGSAWTPGEVKAGSVIPSVLSLAAASDGDGRSLLLTGCEAPTIQSALVGGSTVVGEDSLLTIVNPGSQPVRVSVSAFGAGGSLGELPQPLTVAAHSSATWMPATWFPDESRLSLLLASDGEGIAAWMQSSARSGEVSQGLARLVARPLREQNVFVGVSEASGVPVLRLFNPTDQDLPVRVSSTTADGLKELPGTAGLVVAPGAVFEINLAGIGKDPTAVVASADSAFSASLSYQVVGAPDPVVPDQDTQTRTLAAPTTPVRQVDLPALPDLTEALTSRGFGQVEASLTVANLGQRAVTVEDTTVAPGDSHTWTGKELAALPTSLSVEDDVYVGLKITADTKLGPVESLVDLGYGGIVSGSREVTLVP